MNGLWTKIEVNLSNWHTDLHFKTGQISSVHRIDPFLHVQCVQLLFRVQTSPFFKTQKSFLFQRNQSFLLDKSDYSDHDKDSFHRLDNIDQEEIPRTKSNYFITIQNQLFLTPRQFVTVGHCFI
jgi:hypothetical protein